MPARKRICVYCGSSPGNDPAFLEGAIRLGAALAKMEFDLVYGGASIGLMGTVANAALDNGAAVYGVMPQSLADQEIAHQGLSELFITSSMHDRKEKMADLSDGFIAMPGGLGTLEELFEIWTWAQLGFHDKPVGLMNIAGFYDLMIEFLEQTRNSGFVRPSHHDMLIVDSDPSKLLMRMQKFKPDYESKVTRPSDQR